MTYLDNMEMNYHLHITVQQCNFIEKMLRRKFFFLSYFFINNHKYARYGSWCVHQMRNRDSLYIEKKITSLCNHNQDTPFELPLISAVNRAMISGELEVLEDSQMTTILCLNWLWEELIKLKVSIHCWKCTTTTVRRIQAHTSVTDSVIWIPHIQCCCGFRDWLR